jgi:hypothetical protein
MLTRTRHFNPAFEPLLTALIAILFALLTLALSALAA